MPRLDPEYHKEVQTYFKRMNATKEERNEAWYWVHRGIDIYDNPWFYYNEAGYPADLILAIRMDKDQQEWFNSLSAEDQTLLRTPPDSTNLSLEDLLLMNEDVT